MITDSFRLYAYVTETVRDHEIWDWSRVM